MYCSKNQRIPPVWHVRQIQHVHGKCQHKNIVGPAFFPLYFLMCSFHVGFPTTRLGGQLLLRRTVGFGGQIGWSFDGSWSRRSRATRYGRCWSWWQGRWFSWERRGWERETVVTWLWRWLCWDYCCWMDLERCQKRKTGDDDCDDDDDDDDDDAYNLGGFWLLLLYHDPWIACSKLASIFFQLGGSTST